MLFKNFFTAKEARKLSESFRNEDERQNAEANKRAIDESVRLIERTIRKKAKKGFAELIVSSDKLSPYYGINDEVVRELVQHQYKVVFLPSDLSDSGDDVYKITW